MHILRTAALAAAVAASSAEAGTIELDIYGHGFVQPTANRGAQGLFPEEGFLLTATLEEGFFTEGGALANLGSVNDQVTGLTSDVQGLTLTRPPGRTFDLVSLEVPFFYAAWLALYDGVARSFGGSDPGRYVSDAVYTLYDVVELTGIKADGSVVEGSFLPFDAERVLELRPEDLPPSGAIVGRAADPVFGPEEFGPGFVDIVALRLEAGRPTDEDVCRPENLVRIDPRFVLSGLCSGVEFPDAPLSDITTMITDGGSRNDYTFFHVDAITVAVPGGTVAPVPLPASLPLLAAGLLGLGWAGRHARGRGLQSRGT